MLRSIKAVSRALDDLALRPLTWENSVSEDRLHQIANALWVLSSFLTMRGNSAVTRLAQGWMLAGVLALDWPALVWVRRRSGSPA